MAHGWDFLTPEDKDAIFDAVMDADAPCPGPFHLEIDPIDVCNADCYFCNSAEIRQGAVLGWDRVHRLLEDARPRGLRSIRLSGGGEPTLYPQTLDLLGWLEANDVRLDNMTSNGIRLKGALAEALARVPPAFFMISLNYATRERYQWGMRIPAVKFDQICENVLAFNEMLMRTGAIERCQMHTQFMISRETLGDLPAMFELADRLGLNGMTIRGLHDRTPEERLTPEERARLMRELRPLAHAYKDRVWVMFDLAMEGLAEEQAALTAEIHAHHPTRRDEPEAEGHYYCLMPWYSLAVLGSGKVYPCCILLSSPDVEPLGNLATQSLDEVWNGPAFRKYRGEIRRSMILDGPVPRYGSLCCHTVGMCWKSGGCSLAYNLAQPEDFVRLARLIGEERRSLPGRATRMKYRAMRRGIDFVRGVQAGLSGNGK